MAFTAGQKLRAGDLNAISTAVAAGGGDGNTTSATYVDLSVSGLTRTFTAPPSGAVLVWMTGELWSDSGAQSARFDFRINVTSGGALFRAASDATALMKFGTNSVRASVTNIISGLTPGTGYTLTGQLRSSNAGTDCHLRTGATIVATLGA